MFRLWTNGVKAWAGQKAVRDVGSLIVLSADNAWGVQGVGAMREGVEGCGLGGYRVEEPGAPEETLLSSQLVFLFVEL